MKQFIHTVTTYFFVHILSPLQRFKIHLETQWVLWKYRNETDDVRKQKLAEHHVGKMILDEDTVNQMKAAGIVTELLKITGMKVQDSITFQHVNAFMHGQISNLELDQKIHNIISSDLPRLAFYEYMFEVGDLNQKKIDFYLNEENKKQLKIWLNSK